MTSDRNEGNWGELDSLISLFEETLQATTKVRNILAWSNQQTRELLTEWEIPESPYEEPACTCNVASGRNKEELNEIVRDVEQAVENAQKIREQPERLRAKQKDISPLVAVKINSCTRVSAESKKDILKTSLPVNRNQVSSNIPTRSTSKLGENMTRKLSIKSSKTQTTYQKDFKVPSISPRFRQLSASPRLCSTKEISAQESHKLKDDEPPSKLGAQSISGQHRIAAKKVSGTCPVHGDGKWSKQQSSSVDLAEAVDVLGVPPEMVKYLRSYHSFVTSEGKPIKLGKGKKAAERFIGALTEANCRQWKDVEQEPLGTLFTECVPLFTQVFGTEQLDSNIETRIENLDKKCQKWFNLSESVVPNVYSAEQVTKMGPLQDSSLLNGMWNFKSSRQYKVFQYIRYSSPAQWRKLFKNMQDIQRLDLQLRVFDELEAMIPLFGKCTPGDPSFILLFKAMCTICDITKLSLPVIIINS